MDARDIVKALTSKANGLKDPRVLDRLSREDYIKNMAMAYAYMTSAKLVEAFLVESVSDFSKFLESDVSTPCPPCTCGHSGWEHFLLRGECDRRADCGCSGFKFSTEKEEKVK